MKILLIEDDLTTTAALTQRLATYHYIIDVVTDGETGWIYATTFEYDLIILEVCLPKLDGLSFCRRFRADGYVVPLLFLTAQGSSLDKIRGLDAGADDYVTKPFDMDELSARIRALLRRSSATPFPHLIWGELILDPSTCEVTYGDRPLTLTTKEYELLELFLRDCRYVYSAEEILDRLWSSEEFPVESTVRSHLRRLRQKLTAAGAPPDFISTLHGRGYYLKAESPPVEPSQTLNVATSQSPDLYAPLLLMVIQGAADPMAPCQTTALANAAAAAGLRTAIATTLEQAQSWLHADLNRLQQPSAILLELPSAPWGVNDRPRPPARLFPPDALKPSTFDLSLLQDFAVTYPDLPLLVLGRQLELFDRLDIVQHGGKIILELPAPAEEVIAAVCTCLSRIHKGLKVMVVDDDQTLLRTLTTLLNPWGFKVSTLAAPQQFWSVLEAVNPDALVLDIKMPQINGLELCQILRSDLRWQQLPVLLLSELSDVQIQQRAFAVGADDYLCKPIAGQDLAHRILNRLQRSAESAH